LAALADGHDHQVSVRGKHPNSLVLQSLVGSNRHDLAVALGNHHAAVECPFSWVIAPGDETVDDLHHLVQPR